MDPDTIKVLKKIVIDLLCLFAVGFPVLLFYVLGEPYKRGFFCDDDSIRYPYKESTVTNTVLYIGGLFLPISVMIVIEIMHWRRGEDGETYTLWGKRIPLWLSNSYKTIGVFGFGAACSQFITDVGKYSIGRLRPHFMAICVPNIDCSTRSDPHEYITDYICTGFNSKLVRESRLSFPSGHSSFSSYTMVYLVLYLQCRFTWKGSHLIKHVAQFFCILLTWGTALSRVSNYKHHWSDVLVGLMIGVLVAIINATCVSDMFKKKANSDRLLIDRIDLSSTSQALTAKNDTTANL